MELVCPAGSLPALKAAIDNGADCVYIGFRDDTRRSGVAPERHLDRPLRGGRKRRLSDAVQRPQSAQTYNLVRELDELEQLGVDVLRISPQSAVRTYIHDRRTIPAMPRSKHHQGLGGAANGMPRACCSVQWLLARPPGARANRCAPSSSEV
jgi:collagenase-like PrtC family protease